MQLLRTNFRRVDALLLIASFLLVAFYVMTAGSGFPLDDSWIHQTYARNLAQNGEWAFVPGEPSAASTSPLYTVLLAIGYIVGLPYVLWTHFLGATALALMSMLIVRMVEWQLPNMQYGGLIGGLFSVTSWHMIWAAASGMETIIFSMLTIVLIYLAWRELYVESSMSVVKRGALFGIVTALTTLARPEGILLSGLIGMMMLLTRPQGNIQQVIIYGVASLFTFALVMSPYIMLNIQLTGGFLPNTANAKFQQHEILLQLPYLTRVQNLIYPLLAGGQILLIPGLLIYGWVIVKIQKSRQLLLMTPLLWSIALTMVYASRLPAAYQHGRYVMPILPSIILVGVIGILYIVNQRKQSLVPRVLSRVLLISALLTSLAFAFVIAPPIYSIDVAIINEEMVASASWIDENIPDDELLAIHDIGAVGFFSSRPMLDIAGLVSPDIAPIVEDADALWEYMQERNAQYLMAFPNQIPGNSVDDDRLCQVFITDGKTVRRYGEPNMAIYRLAWDGDCDV
jgi:4-amino-4-deoxy-L-arabinose transferase-like glycosyltransferase